MAKEVMYYLFIEGKPINYFETELEAEAEFEDWCSWNGRDPKTTEHHIDPFIDFDEEHPDPYDEYEDF